MSDFDFDPVPGLPARLPTGETMLWQGRPAWRDLAMRRFRAPWIAGYFAILALWGAVSAARDGGGALQAATLAGWLVALGAAAVGLAVLFAWLVARNTIYTITSKRIVMRIGVALPISLNIPFRVLESADLVSSGGEAGDIVLTLMPGERIAWLQLWPHTLRWRLARPRPTLLALPAARSVAETLGRAVAAAARERGDLRVQPGLGKPGAATGDLVLAA